MTFADELRNSSLQVPITDKKNKKQSRRLNDALTLLLC